jgi:hypothetical protein
LTLRDPFSTATMKFTQSIRFLLAGSAALLAPTVVTLEDGEDICVQGFIVDNLCINQRFYIDLPDLDPLVNPELHTYKCMVNPPQCNASGWALLGAPDSEGANYTRDLVFDQDGNNQVFELIKATGYGGENAACTGCTGTDPSKIAGFVAGVQATVVDADAVPPVVSIRALKYTGSTTGTEYCTVVEANATMAPTMAPAAATTPEPAPSGASSIKASLLLLVSWVALF